MELGLNQGRELEIELRDSGEARVTIEIPLNAHHRGELSPASHLYAIRNLIQNPLK